MVAAQAATLREPGDAPRLRLEPASSVTLHAPRKTGDPWIIQESSRNKYYRVGADEASFLGELIVRDGDVEFASRSTKLSRSQLEALCGWLIAHELVVVDESTELTVQAAKTAASSGTGRLSWGSLYFARVPIGNPDPILERCKDWTDGLFSKSAELTKGVLILVGMAVVVSGWSDFVSDSTRLVTASRGLSFLAAWSLLKFVHELSHALACKLYGGHVPQWGAAFILLMPIAYVDVSSGWLFDSRWRRFHVTLAGVVSECVLAATAAFVWSQTTTPWLQLFCVDIIVLAVIGSLFFNANPLLKFDGYFALADLTGIDNLYEISAGYARYWGRRYLLGLAEEAPSLPGQHAGWIRIYALATAAYRAFAIWGLILAATYLLGGWGIVVAAIGVVLFVGLPAMRLVTLLREAHRCGRFSWAGAFYRISTLTVLGCMLLFVIPATGSRSAPGVVQFDPPIVLRAPSDGFVRRVLVRDGEDVEAGQLLMVMKSDALQSEVERLRIELARAEQIERTAHLSKDTFQLGHARAELRSLKEQLDDANDRIEALKVRAPQGGTVVARRLQEAEGSFRKEGDELLLLGTSKSKRICLSVTPSQASDFGRLGDRGVPIDVAGCSRLNAAVQRIEMRASVQPADASLTAQYDGPLPAILQDDGTAKLPQPHVKVYLSLTESQSRNLRCGQRCYAYMPRSHVSILGNFFDDLRTYIPL
ncbi:MAG TPA: hypothetical protein DDW52_02910 [Planctomycetaceae bacterium]|nr:hypothetical protein [Planctomycetaceae bacterium]